MLTNNMLAFDDECPSDPNNTSNGGGGSGSEGEACGDEPKSREDDSHDSEYEVVEEAYHGDEIVTIYNHQDGNGGSEGNEEEGVKDKEEVLSNGDDLMEGNNEPYKLTVPMSEIEYLTRRFKVISKEERMKSLSEYSSDKYAKAMVNIPLTAPGSEEEYENYLDELKKVHDHQNVPAWYIQKHVMPGMQITPGRIQKLMKYDDVDRMFDALAKQLFARPNYAQKLDCLVNSTNRQTTVAQATTMARELIVRQTRVGARRLRPGLMGTFEPYAIEVLVRHLPLSVAHAVARVNYDTFHAVHDAAQDIEAQLSTEVGHGGSVFSIEDLNKFQGNNVEGERRGGRAGRSRRGRGATNPNQGPYQARGMMNRGRGGAQVAARGVDEAGAVSVVRQEGCFICGGLHYKSECPDAKKPCHHCLRVGHAPHKCWLKFGRGGSGTPEVINHELNADKLLTVLSRTGKGEVILSLDSGKPQVTIRANNTYECIGLVDTGASRTVISSPDVKRLGMQLTDKSLDVKGIGSASAVELKTARLEINGVMLNVDAITIVGNQNIPNLIGRPELRRLNQIINLSDMTVEEKCEETYVMEGEIRELEFENKSRQITELSDDDCFEDIVSYGCMINLSDEEGIEINLCEDDKRETVFANEQYEIIKERMEVKNVTESPVQNTVTGVSIAEKEKIVMEKLSHLDFQLQKKYWNLFNEYGDIWREPQSGKMTTEASFVVTGKPVVAKQRPLSGEMMTEFKKQVDDMLLKGVIQPSKSEWGSVPVFVKKKEGAWRMALDFRRLNQQATFDAYPLPRLWDQVNSLSGYSLYSALDANWGFWNLRLAENSKKYTAIVTPWGLYEFNVLPFGIKNSPGEFQRAMDIALKCVSDFAKCYIDDITFGAMNEEEHYIRLKRTFQACRDGGVYLKVEKAHIMQKRLVVLGHVVDRKGVSPDPKKVDALKKLKAPANKEEVRSFVGAVQFLNRYFNLAEKMAPLINLTRLYVRFEWLEEHETAFNDIKNMLSDKIRLTKYNPALPLGLVTDASDKGIGACLFQVVKDQMLPLEFYSKKLTDAELKYDVREKEMLAIRRSIEHFENICKATHTYIFTDHESLRWMWNSDRGRIQRWSLYIQQFSLTLLYLPGKCNVIADWLSRAIDDTEEAANELDVICCPEVMAVQELDVTPRKLRVDEWWETKDEVAPMVPTLKQFAESYEMDDIPEQVGKCNDGVYRYLVRQKVKLDDESQGDGTLKVGNLDYSVKGDEKFEVKFVPNGVIYVPRALREVMLFWFHASESGGHRGFNKTNQRMRKYVGWTGMSHDLNKYIKSCPCRRMLTMSNKSFRSVRGVLEAPRPQELISIDFIGPKSWKGSTYYVSCIIDHATRFMFNVVSSTNKAKDAVRSLEAYNCIFGSPQAVLHDNGSEYVAEEFQQFVRGKLRARTVRTSPYYPQGNGINESSHQSVNAMIASQILCAQTNDFMDVIRRVTTVYNATPHGRLGCSPFYAMFGSEMMFPGWQNLVSHPKQEQKLANMEAVRIRHAIESRLKEFDQYRINGTNKLVRVGDWIRYKLGDYEKNSHFGSAHVTDTVKFQPRWSFPCKVMNVRGSQVTVQMLGAPYEPTRKVPMKLIRIMPTEIPVSLAKVNIDNMKFEQARFPVQYRHVGSRAPISMENMMNLAREQDVMKRDSTGVPGITRIMCADIVAFDDATVGINTNSEF